MAGMAMVIDTPATKARAPSWPQTRHELNRIKSNSLENSYLIGDPAAGDAADLFQIPKMQPKYCRVWASISPII